MTIEILRVARMAVIPPRSLCELRLQHNDVTIHVFTCLELYSMRWQSNFPIDLDMLIVNRLRTELFSGCLDLSIICPLTAIDGQHFWEPSFQLQCPIELTRCPIEGEIDCKTFQSPEINALSSSYSLLIAKHFAHFILPDALFTL